MVDPRFILSRMIPSRFILSQMILSQADAIVLWIQLSLPAYFAENTAFLEIEFGLKSACLKESACLQEIDSPP